MLLRLASNRAFGIYDLPREGYALAAAQFTTQQSIGLSRAAGATAYGAAYVAFSNGIADTNDHDDPRYCESFATLLANVSQQLFPDQSRTTKNTVGKNALTLKGSTPIGPREFSWRIANQHERRSLQ